jgi:hypothetical protein
MSPCYNQNNQHKVKNIDPPPLIYPVKRNLRKNTFYNVSIQGKPVIYNNIYYYIQGL